jgi:type II secretory pathway component PulF
MAFFEKINLTYAKFMVRNSNSNRLKFYKKLAALLRNNFTLMASLDRLWNIASVNGKKPSEPMALAISSWQHELEQGQTFGDALSNWVPSREKLMLTVGDVARLEKALVHVIKVSDGTTRIISPLISAIAYPLFLLALTFLILIAVSLYLVPPLTEAAGKEIIWSGVASTLITLSDFLAKYWWLIPTVAIILIILIAASLPYWKGKLRVYFDKIAPWSLYRMFTGVSWLLSLASLVKSGTPISKSMGILRDNSTPYLADRINKALGYISEGENLGTALFLSKQDFPDTEIIGDLQIYSELDNFEEALEGVADEYLESSISNIERIANILNSVAILLIAVVIAWVIFGTFEMQEQLTQQM